MGRLLRLGVIALANAGIRAAPTTFIVYAALLLHYVARNLYSSCLGTGGGQPHLLMPPRLEIRKVLIGGVRIIPVAPVKGIRD